MANPFKPGTLAYETFKILSDLNWHCADCELPGSQPAATIRDLRRMGYEILTAAIKADNPPRYCKRCNRKTTHYRLKSLSVTSGSITRTGLPAWLKQRIFKLYDYREALTGRKRNPKDLTVDHRVPNIRWPENEKPYDQNISDEELRNRFQLLTNEDNLWKSRMCEECKKSGKRQPFLGIYYFYEGTEDYNESIGCRGCGWYDPDSWRRSLNNLIKNLRSNE